MNKIYTYILVISLGLGFVSCAANELEQIDGNGTTEPIGFVSSDYNAIMSSVAVAINKALNVSPELRGIVKRMTLEKFDGDYDVLLNNMCKQKISDVSSTRSIDGQTTVGMLLDDLFPISTKSATSQSYIDEICKAFPMLQVSIPIHADKWDVNNYIPTIVFINGEFKEGESKYVPGYDAQGNYVNVDAINEPSHPVIVVGQNERYEPAYQEDYNGNINKIGDIKPFIPQDSLIIIDPPIINPPIINTTVTPINVSGSRISTGIMIQWELPNQSDYSNVTGYRVYRSCSYEQNALVGIISGAYNTQFIDEHTVNGELYTYYVRSRKKSMQSLASASVNVVAPTIPDAVVDFSVQSNNPRQVELRWNYIHDTNHDRTVISRKTPQNTTYQDIATIENRDDNYIDNNIIPGQQYSYRIRNYNTQNNPSSSAYDIIYAPYRNITYNSPIYIHGIKYTCRVGDIESWMYGAPDFHLRVYEKNATDNSPVTVIQRMRLDYSNRDDKVLTCSPARKLLDWRPDSQTNWYEKYTIYAAEYDYDNNWGSISISLGFNIKDISIKNAKLDVNGSINCTINSSLNDQVCGTTYIDYFANPAQKLEYPNFGFMVLINDSTTRPSITL